MADNSQYGFGMDWYEGNRINSWPALVQWDKQVRFAYFRLGIGYHADNLALLNQCAEQTEWDLGGFYEVGLPVIPKDTMVKVLRDQLAACGHLLSLPISLAFEPQGWVGKTPLWPSVGDLRYIGAAIIALGYKVNIYTNESGLKIIKASGLIDLASADWWYSSTLAFPLWSTERGVDSIVTFLQTKYGIQREHVQFIQTLIDHGTSPIGTGQDFDRAVSWSFDEQPPAPTVEKHLLEMLYADGQGQTEELTITLKHPAEQIDLLYLDQVAFPGPAHPLEPQPEPEPQPQPEPQPEPIVVDDTRYGLLRTEIIDNGITNPTEEQRAAGKKPGYTPAVSRMQQRPIPDDKKGDPIPITEAERAFVVAINPPEGAHYVNETVGMMIINSPGKAESISGQHNAVSWKKDTDQGGCHKLQCFQGDDDFRGFIGKVDFTSRPDLIFKCNALNLQGDFIKVTSGIDAYGVLMARPVSQDGTGELWKNVDSIEEFPRLPVTVTIKTSAGLIAREIFDANSERVASYDQGTQVKVYQYKPRGRSIWGRTKDGWIALRVEGVELTDWHLETPTVV